MSIQRILQCLTENKTLTASQEAVLRNIRSKREFLSRVAAIYEEKLELFLSACDFYAKGTLNRRRIAAADLDAVAAQKIIEYAHGALLKAYGFSTVPMLSFLLEGNGEDLLDSLGLKAVSKHGEHLHLLAKQTFKSYAARMLLFHEIGIERLQGIVTAVAAEDPAIFPPHLYNAFVIETHLAAAMERAPEEEHATLFRINAPAIRQCVESVASYLGDVIHRSEVSPEKRERYFRHLNDQAAQVGFSRAIAAGFSDAMAQEANQLKVKRKQMDVMSAAISQACTPALTLIGIRIRLDLSGLRQSIADAEKALTDHHAKKAVLDKKYEDLKTATHQKIDAWRSSVPDRPVTWGIQLINVPM